MIRKILDKIERIIMFISTILMGIIVVVLFYAVVMRYVFHRPPSWSMELGRYLFLWMVILTAVLVTREKSHIQITFLVNMLPSKLRFIWMNINRLLMIGFCGVMVYQGLAIYPIVSQAASPSLGISMGWLYLSVPVGGLLMGVYLLESIVASIIAQTKTTVSGEDAQC